MTHNARRTASNTRGVGINYKIGCVLGSGLFRHPPFQGQFIRSNTGNTSGVLFRNGEREREQAQRQRGQEGDVIVLERGQHDGSGRGGAGSGLQLGLLQPKIAILDETDSGLDVDALRIVSEAFNAYKAMSDVGTLLITHYTRILRYISPDVVHVFVDGRIVESGGRELADLLESEGYERFLASA